MPEHERHQATDRTDQSEASGQLQAAFEPRTAFILGAQRGYGNALVARALAQRQAADGPAPAAKDAAAPSGLIVGGDTAPAGGQMSRDGFLDRLRADAVAAASEVLEGTLWVVAVDASVDEWLAPYRTLDAAALEAAVKARVPAAASARDAATMLAAVRAEIRQTLARRLQSEEPGEETPPFSLAELPGARIAAEVADIMFKRRDDGPARTGDPLAVRRRLGRGEPLESSVRARMEPLLGEDLGGVRVHAEGEGARVAGELGARALTTGRHVAFGAGEYAPGTPVGDALLAHELAHVAQQEPGGAPGAEAALEHDADEAAAGAVAALWAPEHPAVARLQRRPRLRDGLALRRCTGPDKKTEKDAGAAKDAGPANDAEPQEPMPANPKQVYDQKLQEAMPVIQADFGRAEKGRFDKRYWRLVPPSGKDAGAEQDAGGEAELELLPGRWPSTAITAMITDHQLWTLDCAQAVQLAHLYALRYALGATAFNQRVGRAHFRFRPHDSSGVEGATEWWRPGIGLAFRRFQVEHEARKRNPKGDPEARTEQQLLDDAPVGSRVMFTNQMASDSAAFHHENSVKLGPDAFAAHGFPGGKKTFTRRELERALAKAFTHEEPTESFITGNIFIQAIETYRADLPGGVPSGPP